MGLIVGLTSLAGAITGTANQPVAHAISTPVIATLFTSARHPIQALIDRRFCRKKYNAARTLDAFSATLQSEVDLGELRAHLLSGSTKRCSPAQVSRLPAPAGTTLVRTGSPPGTAQLDAALPGLNCIGTQPALIPGASCLSAQAGLYSLCAFDLMSGKRATLCK